MAKAVKSAVKVFVVTYLVATGLSLALGSATMLGPILFGVETTLLAGLSAVSTLVGGLLSKGMKATTAENFGTKIASRTATAPRQIIYGKARVGGTITHIETSGTDNYKLSMIVVLAGHEVESLEDVLINDEFLTTVSSGGFEYATNSKFVNADNENKFSVQSSLLRYVFVDGSQTTANSNVVNNTSLTSSDKFIGMSYMFIEMVVDSEAFGGGIPPMAFIVKGKKVFDPRTSSTAWSSNPALCVRDYITDTNYGLKATSSEVLDTTALGGFSSAANTCDSGNTIGTATVNGAISSSTFVTIDTSSTFTLIDVGYTVTGTGITGVVKVVRRRGLLITLSTAQTIADGVTLTFTDELYTANGITNMSASGSDVIQGLLSSCAGKLSYINGKFVMFAGASVSPDMTITDDNLLAPVSIATKQSSGESFNTVKAVYVDANNNYIATDTPVYTDSTFLSNDTPTGESSANYRKSLEIQLPFTDTTTMAQRLQRTALLHTRKELSVSVLCNIAFMQLQPFDWVYLTNKRLGFTNKTFEVLSTNLEVIGSDDVPVLATRLALKEIDSSVYAFASSSYTSPIDEGTNVSTGSFAVTAPTNFAVANPVVVVEQATTNISVNTTWTNNPSDDVQGTEIKYGTSSGTYTESAIVGKGVTSLNITNLLQNQTYFFVARHFSANNVFSSLTSQVSKATGASTTAPSVPTNLDASDGSPLSVKVSWTNPNNSDLSSVKIYATTSNSAPTNETTLKATVTGEPNAISTISFGEQDGLTAGTTFYFWAKAVNKTGLTSAFTSSNSGNFTKVEAPDINLPDFSGYFHKEGNTTTALTSSQFNTEYGRTPLNDDILIMVNTSASPKVSKAYKWNGSAFVEISNFTTGDLIVDGTIAGAKVIARTIEAGNIATGTLTANEIKALTITANEIATDAITAVKIDVVNLQAISSDLGAISGGSLNIGSGTFVVASNGALTATSATITGAVTATSGSFTGSLTSTSGTIGGFTLGSTSLVAGSGTSRVSLSTADGIHLGNNTFGSAPFRVTRAGALTATNATITGAITATSGSFAGSLSSASGTFTGALSGGTISIGSSNNIFKADSNGIYLGNASFGSAPFKVTPAGVMSATGASISGSITATSLNVTGATVTGTLDASAITLNGEPLNNLLAYSSAGSGSLTILEVANINGDFVVNGNFEATGSQPDLIVGKVTGISSDTVQADAILRSSTGSGGFRIQAGTGNTQVVGLVYDAIGGTTLSADGGASGTFKINADGALALTFDSSQNATFTASITASGNVTAFSDKRLKENIQTLDSKKSLKMRGVSFIKNGTAGSGVIAQEIEQIAPELVSTANDEMGTKSVAYGNLVGYLIETVKDQQKQIDELKQRILS